MAAHNIHGSSASRRVVVIGGGFAGSSISRSLQFDCDLTLVDSKEYFEITWANARCVLEPSFGARSLINHKDYLSNTRIIASRAIKITETEVITESDRVLPYDYLVIATGHSDPLPKTKHERLQHYESDHEKIKAAQSILIVGGGPTGVELAGEITVDFPEKRITLVHSGHRLMEFIGPIAAQKALNWLMANGVNVKLEQSVDLDSVSSASGNYRTSSGEIIEADCCFLCTGKPIGSAWLKGTMLESCLDRNGRLMVDANLRVKGFNNVFAVGDITDIQENKLGRLAQKHAQVAAKNLKGLMAGMADNEMMSYVAGTKLAFVSLGRKEAVAQFPYFTLRGRIAGFIKSKNLFVGATRKKLGLGPDIVDES